MELEEMKTLWETMSRKVESQELLTDKLIMEMTQQKYKNKFSTLSMYETTGAIICIITAGVIVFNLDKMTAWYNMVCSIIAIVLLVGMPIISLHAIYGLRRIDIAKNSFKTALGSFMKKKRRLLLIQQLAVPFSCSILFFTLPVFSMIMNDKDFFQQQHSPWFWIFIAGVVVGVFFFARWGYGCYKRVTASAEDLLRELER